MAKKTNKKGKTRRPTKAELERQKAIKRLLLSLALTLLLLIAALRLGAFGVTVYNLIRLLAGSLAYVVIATTIFYLFAFKWVDSKKGLRSGFLVFFLGLLLFYQAYFALKLPNQASIGGTFSYILQDLHQFKVVHFAGGGLLGALIYQPISFLLANLGSFLFALLLMATGGLMMSPYNIYDLGNILLEIWYGWQEKLEAYQAKKVQKKELDETKPETRPDQVYVDLETGEILDDNLAVQEVEIASASDYQENIEQARDDTIVGDSGHLDETQASDDEVLDFDELDLLSSEVSAQSDVKQYLTYKLPSINLFSPIKEKNQSGEKKVVRQNIHVLEETFKSFGIDVKVERAEIGPSVTKYEVKPAVGVRVSRISNLADDLALALAAKDVRIEAPIPGKSLVGIEIPNSEIATVGFRDLWEQSQTQADKLLEIPLGKAVNGSSRSFDLARMPHLLVAGSTGSGKSVAVNGIIASILMKAKPDQVKFMMVDPKMVELSVYNDIPHLLIPVVTNPRKASRALQKVVDEMEKRYELFSRVGVRNIAGYNAKVESFNAKNTEKQVPLPLIVVIVDELADLMMVASKEVEDAIIRLGQKARAAGIHMILATQRPSVDVISGLIKANVPSRIAFAVSSGTDSRTILDENGAEKLLGRGDMLFKPIDENHPVRLQGAFISDEDVERMVNFIKNQAEAAYDETFDPGEVSEADMNGGDSVDSAGDPLFEEARSLVIETQKASASMLQRRLSVGFNRATRLMEELEEAGVIGPAEGTKPRKVLVK